MKIKKLIFHGGTYTASTNHSSAVVIYGNNYSNSTINITGGTFNNTWSTTKSNYDKYGCYSRAIDIYDGAIVNMSGGTVTQRSYGPGGIFVYNRATLNFSGSAYVYAGSSSNNNYIYNVEIAEGSHFNMTGGTIATSRGYSVHVQTSTEPKSTYTKTGGSAVITTY